MARTLGPGSLSIGLPASPKQWAGDITKSALTPSTDSDDPLIFLDGSEESGEETTTWQLDLTIHQDFTLDSLEVWCLENAGKEMPFVWVPNEGAGGLKISGTVKIRPVAWGGDVKKKNTSDAQFPLVGQPTVTEM